MSDSIEKGNGKPKEERKGISQDVLSILFLLAITTLMILILPRLLTAMTYPKERPIDIVVPIYDDVIVIPVPINDPGPVVGPHNQPRPTQTPEEPVELVTAKPTVLPLTDPAPTVPPATELPPITPRKQRKPHPEQFDDDDLPLLYEGLNPNPSKSEKRILYRLAEWILPIKYEVLLRVKVKGHNGARESSVDGDATITFKVEGSASNLLEIHGEFFSELTFKSLTGGHDDTITKIHDYYNEQKRVHSFLLDRPLVDGETYKLALRWTASIGYGTAGLYETWYSDGATNRYSLVTHGQPMSTRKWMPCFDEPAMKALLHLSVVHPSSLNARSNGRFLSTESFEGNKTKTSFAPTPFPISPYLFALSVTDFVDVKDTVEGIPISVVVPPSHRANLSGCLELAKKSVLAYLKALNADRIFDKIDFIFVPDHSSAMEDVGHISVGIDYLDDYDTYAHEMMHNYFGNLVTLKWWDEVWINEGLATMYEIDAVNGIGTEEAHKNLRSRRRSIMESDSHRKSIPLKFDVNTEVEAHANFKKPYSKGTVVLNMIRNVVGEKTWKEGVELFLHRFAYQSVEGMDFLNAIKEVASRDHGQEKAELTTQMARSFFENRGFPLVRIKRSGKTLEITQERFHRGYVNGSQKENKERWVIPIHLITIDGAPYRSLFFTKQNTSITIDTNYVVLLDPTKVVYYRVVYDEIVYKNVAENKYQSEAVKNEIVDDVLNAAFSGYAEPKLAFDAYFLMTTIHLRNTLWVLQSEIALLQPDRFYSIWSTFTEKDNHTQFEEYKRNRNTPREIDCEGVDSVQVAMKKYIANRTTGMVTFLCPQIDNEQFSLAKFIGAGLDLSKPQAIHPRDFENLLPYVTKKKGNNIVAEVLREKAYFSTDDAVLALMISRAGGGLDPRSTPILEEIARIARGPARQNAVLITRLFNERKAIETQDKILGQKLDEAYKEALSQGKKLRKTKKSAVEEHSEIPEEKFIRNRFY